MRKRPKSSPGRKVPNKQLFRKKQVSDFNNLNPFTNQDLEEVAIFLALASSEQVKNGKPNKSPAISWTKYPDDYTGVRDPNYGSGILCDYIPKIDLYLTVIDLDKPKNPDHVKLKDLKDIVKPIIGKTLTKITPSGGWHIYLLSVEQPEMKVPHGLNIDYQTKKYAAYNYRWSPDGTRKQRYEQHPDSINKIEIVQNSDSILEKILDKLNDDGKIETPIQKKRDELITILKQNVREGTRQYYSCAIAGALRKAGYKQNQIVDIIRRVFTGDDEINSRINNVKRTFDRPIGEVLGMKWLEENIPPVDYQKLQELLKPKGEDLKSQIVMKLIKNDEPKPKVLADYINSKLDLYTNLDTMKYYEKDVRGRYEEIDEKRIIEFCNEEFGYNSINQKLCNACLKYVTTPIKKNYDLIEFTNGILNTSTQYFTEDKEEFTDTPKIVLPFNWDKNSKPGKIGEVIDRILDHPSHKEDKDLWMRAVGHAFMGINRIGKLVLVQGPSGTGKSTLHAILKRIFNYSMLQMNKINANERFILQSIIDKDVNIDDDVNNGMLKGIGHLNTIVTGEGLEVEVKGENRRIICNNQMIPRLFAAGNSLPPVFGDGFQRRLLLIHADNQIQYEDRDDQLVADISLGKYDKDGLEWLVYTAINMYWENEGKPLTSKEQEESMLEEFEFKSWPLKKGIEIIFDTVYDKYIPSKEINRIMRNWCEYAFQEKLINKEHRKPSVKHIEAAMNANTYYKDRIYFPESGDQIMEYLDIQLKPEWEFLRRRSRKPAEVL